MAAERLTFLEKVEKLDRRWVFLLMLLAISFPLFVKMNLPIRVSPAVRGFYEAIENLKPGDVVYFAADYDPGSKPELDPMLIAALNQLFAKDIKVVGATLWPAGPPLLERGLKEVAVDTYHKKYGIDFVNLGFKEGKENVMVQLGKSFRGVYPNDYYGTPVDRLPLLAAKKPNGRWAIDNFKDVKLIVNISAGYPGTKEWVQQVRSRYDIPIVAGVTAVSAPEYYPYVQSGQLSGLLGGLAGAAEYEQLIHRPGWATTGMSAQSLGHVTIIVLIVLGNVVYYLNRRRQPEAA
jgi:hypothetical protein